MSNEEVKPCPFCGGNAVIIDVVVPRFDAYDSPTQSAIRCYNCGIQTDNSDEKSLLKRWNTRHESKALDEEGILNILENFVERVGGLYFIPYSRLGIIANATHAAIPSETAKDITKEKLARALHDHSNYPFPMPESVIFDDLKESARREYEVKAEELIVLMGGYNGETAKDQRIREIIADRDSWKSASKEWERWHGEAAEVVREQSKTIAAMQRQIDDWREAAQEVIDEDMAGSSVLALKNLIAKYPKGKV